MACLAHLGEVERVQAEFDRLHVRRVVVSQGTPESIARFLRDRPTTCAVIGDPGRAVYRAFGLDRVSWASFFRWHVLAAYLGHLRRGGKLRRPYDGEDVRQRGGDFVLNRAGGAVFAHVSRDSADRPDPAAILQAVREAGEP